MLRSFRVLQTTPVYRLFTIFLLIAFNLTPVASYAQDLMWMPAPGVRVEISPKFEAPLLKGLTVHPENPLQFDFLIDAGDELGKAALVSNEAKKEEYRKLIKYFLSALTLPEKDMWVNLSPYEENRVIADNFSKTQMGRDLLAQDYLLKQLTASLIYPEEELGKTFWDRVYKEVEARFGKTEIPVNTFNKVWIVPSEAVVYETKDTAFIVRSHLKVMMEEDYLSMDKNRASEVLGTRHVQGAELEKLSEVASKAVREIVLPAIEKEVNEGKNFALLRQVYSGMILATWYKQALKESLLGKIYMDKSKTAGVELEGQKDKESEGQTQNTASTTQNDQITVDQIYAQYVEAFKKGVYNYIKEDYDPVTEEVIPRKYFSGGFDSKLAGALKRIPSGDLTTADAAILGAGLEDIDRAMVSLDPAGHTDQAKTPSPDQAMTSSGDQRLNELLGVIRDEMWLISKGARGFQNQDQFMTERLRSPSEEPIDVLRSVIAAESLFISQIRDSGSVSALRDEIIQAFKRGANNEVIKFHVYDIVLKLYDLDMGSAFYSQASQAISAAITNKYETFFVRLQASILAIKYAKKLVIKNGIQNQAKSFVIDFFNINNGETIAVRNQKAFLLAAEYLLSDEGQGELDVRHPLIVRVRQQVVNIFRYQDNYGPGHPNTKSAARVIVDAERKHFSGSIYQEAVAYLLGKDHAMLVGEIRQNAGDVLSSLEHSSVPDIRLIVAGELLSLGGEKRFKATLLDGLKDGNVIAAYYILVRNYGKNFTPVELTAAKDLVMRKLLIEDNSLDYLWAVRVGKEANTANGIEIFSRLSMPSEDEIILLSESLPDENSAKVFVDLWLGWLKTGKHPFEEFNADFARVGLQGPIKNKKEDQKNSLRLFHMANRILNSEHTQTELKWTALTWLAFAGLKSENVRVRLNSALLILKHTSPDQAMVVSNDIEAAYAIARYSDQFSGDDYRKALGVLERAVLAYTPRTRSQAKIVDALRAARALIDLKKRDKHTLLPDIQERIESLIDSNLKENVPLFRRIMAAALVEIDLVNPNVGLIRKAIAALQAGAKESRYYFDIFEKIHSTDIGTYIDKKKIEIVFPKKEKVEAPLSYKEQMAQIYTLLILSTDPINNVTVRQMLDFYLNWLDRFYSDINREGDSEAIITLAALIVKLEAFIKSIRFPRHVDNTKLQWAKDIIRGNLSQADPVMLADSDSLRDFPQLRLRLLDGLTQQELWKRIDRSWQDRNEIVSSEKILTALLEWINYLKLIPDNELDGELRRNMEPKKYWVGQYQLYSFSLSQQLNMVWASAILMFSYSKNFKETDEFKSLRNDVVTWLNQESLPSNKNFRRQVLAATMVARFIHVKDLFDNYAWQKAQKILNTALAIPDPTIALPAAQAVLAQGELLSDWQERAKNVVETSLASKDAGVKEMAAVIVLENKDRFSISVAWANRILNPESVNSPEPSGQDIDRAQVVAESPLGGIDLYQTKDALTIQRDGNGVALPVELQDIDNININGLVPNIVEVQPLSVPYLRQLLSLEEQDSETRLSAVSG